MNILVTAGNTQTPVDRVRCITNIFSGRTGAQVASTAFERGHTVTLLTSHPGVLDTITTTRERVEPQWRVRAYRTFDDLDALMRAEITTGGYDAVIHAAAVSDYHVAGVFTHRDGQFEDATAGKVKGSHPELWLKLTPAPKLIDKVRADWGFTGKLVKFKLEVGVSAVELEEIAERSRVHSRADLMVANTLEGMYGWALIGAAPGGYQHIARAELATHLLTTLEVISPSTNRV
ncbi:Phosphopantothenoylcysteine synthase/decarboxylase OS=Lentisphaera araneosa HTCC2155 GN=LNTAR_19847 PE=4 SV=1: DFP [Gemmata massiliana]|uniref:DNA/pantothenate metabolism flavoprotein C-terminal domain-containing protein n=1 Tax=Gemmata massiliana TaxID=1210884 RepID=A0A6P2CWZ8_9BACT|nr:phosphopantothenoylcysteine decarboxylase [Gemmata massiliana]VTR92916.1 Phosphopantothenoylcysteine synthase/decarboxylase OS=Lentisphaera araneosa HTCC2155 GN=LNTAR_19847 PE=4 SV=1: DFP [Gemmata massiliana]